MIARPLPVARPRTVSSLWVKGIADTLAAKGIDAADLLATLRLDAATLGDPDARLAIDDVDRLWALAVARSGDPAIGLCPPGAVQPAMFDVVGFAIMSSEHLLAGLQRLARFIPIVSSAARLHIDVAPEGCWLRMDMEGAAEGARRQRCDFNTSSFINFCRWVTRHDIRPLRIEIDDAAPAELAPYEAIYRCPVHFEQGRNRTLFAHADMALPLHTSNPRLTELHDRHALDRLQHLHDPRISTRARELIVARLPSGEPLRADIASALCMSGRTLQRRLEDEGTSFQQLVDDSRRALAEQYLGLRHLPLTQAAHLLGFSDPSAFFRACRRWFEMSPRQYRQHLTLGASTPR